MTNKYIRALGILCFLTNITHASYYYTAIISDLEETAYDDRNYHEDIRSLRELSLHLQAQQASGKSPKKAVSRLRESANAFRKHVLDQLSTLDTPTFARTIDTALCESTSGSDGEEDSPNDRTNAKRCHFQKSDKFPDLVEEPYEQQALLQSKEYELRLVAQQLAELRRLPVKRGSPADKRRLELDYLKGFLEDEIEKIKTVQ